MSTQESKFVDLAPPEAPTADGAAAPRTEADGRDPEGSARRGAAVREALINVASKGYLFVVAILVLIVGSQLSPFFLTSRNLVSVLITASVVSVLAVGQFFVIVTGGIDLSVGSVAALSSVGGGPGLASGTPLPPAVGVAPVVGGLLGVLHGALIVLRGGP